MLSVLCEDKNTLTIGASTAIFGILGGYVAYLIINWRTLEKYGPARQVITCIVIVLVLISFMVSVGPGVNVLAHLGGFIGGILISLALLPGI